MNTKLTLTIFALIFGLIITSACGYFVYYNTKPTSSFVVTESVDKTVTPTQGMARFSIISRNEDAKVAISESDKMVAKINDVLIKELKITKSDIKSNRNTYKSPKYFGNMPFSSESVPGKEKMETNVSINYEVTIKDLSNTQNTSNIIQAIDAGENGIESFYFGDFVVEDSSKVCDEMEVELVNKLKNSIKNKTSSTSGYIVSQSFEVSKESCKNGNEAYFGAKTTLGLSGGVTMEGVGGAPSAPQDDYFVGTKKLKLSGQAVVVTK